MKRVTFTAPGLSHRQAKRLARAAWSRAHTAGGVSSAIVDRLWSDALLAAERQPVNVATEMLRRTEHLMTLLADRGRWPRA